MTDEPAKTWDAIVARCWDDEEFKERLVADPMATLSAAGVELPDGVTVRVVVESATERALVVPPPPDWALTDDQLSGVHGGWFFPTDCPSGGDCQSGG